MASHSSACSSSANLCAQLFVALNQKISNLEYKKGKNKCSIGVTNGRKIFAWINSHNTRYPKIEIWFLGNLDKAKKFNGLNIRPRKPTAGSWDEYEARFDITNQEQLAEAVELLATISYPASIH